MLTSFFFISPCGTAQSPYENQKLKFEVLSTQDGLPGNWVEAILQDSQGFMWFGTDQGLCRYDGYEFRDFSGNPLDTNSIGNNMVWDIVEDREEIIWVAASNGLFELDRNSGKIARFRTKLDLYLGWFRLLNADSVLWIVDSKGVVKLNKQSGAFTRYEHKPDDPKSLSSGLMYSIFEDKVGRIWIGTESSLNRFEAATEAFTRFGKGKLRQVIDAHVDEQGIFWLLSGLEFSRFNPLTGNIKNYPDYAANGHGFARAAGVQLSICEDAHGYLWTGGYQGDVNIFDPRTERFMQVRPDPNDPHSLPENIIRKIYRDRSDNLWFGTAFSGVAKLAAQHNPFKEYDLGGIYQVRAIAEDNSGTLLIGTWGDYIMAKDKGVAGFKRLFPQVKGSGSWLIPIIYQDQQDTIWCGSKNDLIRLDPVNKRTSHFRFDYETDSRVNAILEDGAGRLWIGGLFSNISLGLFDRQQNKFRYLNTDSTFRKVRGDINALLEDSTGTLWIASSNGLYRIDDIGAWGGEPHPKLKITRYRYNPEDNTSISNNLIWCLYEDQQGDLWVGTNVGLNRFKREDEEFTHFLKHDGLPSNVIYNIIEDHNGDLWLSTPVALCKVDLSGQSPRFRKYDASDGLPNNDFSRALYKRRSGEILVGMTKGLIGFSPDSLKDNPHTPPVAITDLKIHNQSIPCDTAVSRKKHIVLSHNQNFFSLEFAALEFTAPEKNQYAYFLEEFETDWNYSGNRRLANYTNVAPGSYVFRVKASNNDGIWNKEGISLRITILPPWWKTWWAYSIYVSLILGVLYGLRRYELSRQRLKHNLELEQVEADKFVELDKMKSRFFANISHEFRTPLTLISGPVQQMLSGKYGGFKEEVKEQFDLIFRNTRRLLRLVNQLLDISRLESGKMKLQTRPENIVELTRQLAMAFESLATVNDIELNFAGPEEPVTVYLDREHYEKIITNLLSNALKFTPEGGQVTVDVSVPTPNPSKEGRFESPLSGGDLGVGSGKVIEICVRDTGSGISANHLPHIFDRFYQGGDTYAKDTQGSGIGLALTKELVELHHGKIEVASEVGKGTEFTIWLPLGKDHLIAEEIVDIPLNPLYEVVDPSKGETEFSPLEGGARRAGDVLADIPTEKPAKRLQVSQPTPTLLIVEDNTDMRTYMREMLAKSYKIVEAADGQEGFEKATDIFPDIIISDVMMPKMDGFQLCEKTKTDQRTSHIPVILLTAKASGDSKIEGLETGADDYLAKPFDTRELQARLKNLIEQRHKLRERFSREIYLNPKEITVTSLDERFLQKASEIVEKKISDPAFDVDDFVKEMALSRTNLYRKLKALTGLSAKEFIRTIRLKRAAHLLRHQFGNISEIAYEVGFNNPSYFAECFQKQFKQLPSRYKSKHIDQSSS